MVTTLQLLSTANLWWKNFVLGRASDYHLSIQLQNFLSITDLCRINTALFLPLLNKKTHVQMKHKSREEQPVRHSLKEYIAIWKVVNFPLFLSFFGKCGWHGSFQRESRIYFIWRNLLDITVMHIWTRRNREKMNLFYKYIHTYIHTRKSRCVQDWLHNFVNSLSNSSSNLCLLL